MFRVVATVFLALFPLGASAADWPHWLGPTRDGVWTEAGVLDKFPAGGPKQLWQVPCGGGYSGPAVADGKVFLAEYLRHKPGEPKNDPGVREELMGKERVRCLDAKTGKELWKHEYDCDYAISYPCGPRCTPAVDGDRVYALGAMGHLVCLDVATGKPKWAKDFAKDFKAPVPTWGFAGHPLVTDASVVCMVGGPDGTVVAFDKRTGKEKWQVLPGTEAGYCPPTLTEVNGKPQLLVWHPKELVALAPATGDKLWDVKLAPKYGMSVAVPQRHGDRLFVGGIGEHAVLLKFEPGRSEPVELWRGTKDTAVYPTNSTPLMHNGTLYGCDSMTGGLRAVDLATGKRLWETHAPTSGGTQAAKHGTAFLVRHGERFFLMSETGELLIARLTPGRYEELGRAKVIEPTGTAFGRKVAWSPPAFADRCLFVRNDKAIACYDLSAGK